jgi:type I restriction-modification system DNA methylase subunit
MPKQPTTSAPSEIVALVEKFSEHRDQYHRTGYNETLLRRDFLDPFFEALGWDMTNRQGYAEAYRDVIHEDALVVEKSARAPDYCFRIGGTRKFFVEAKKPAVDIKTDVSPAFQLRRYAWTAKLPLSILTDFEEFAVYDCRKKPDKDDKASEARVLLLNYTDYLTRWDEIAAIFSREAILKGSFDKFAESAKKKRGTAPVDEEFLKEIESWREDLAKNLSLRNDSLTDRQLNVAVRRIIDRIIFLRMCEGRGIEEYGRLQSLLNGERSYKRLVELFHRADEKYNSGLFHFQSERGREPPDELTPDLKLDDKVLKDILRRLYYPESPYEFAALPADILGQVYEQFLGKVIRLTASHRAKIEEKPEVRKAGGVYYTPTYIVDYIVENTVGKLLEGKTPQEVGGLTPTLKPAKNARPLSVLDPACGSGSFLIVAYQYLLDWYLKQYTENDDPKNHSRGANPRVYQAPTGDWRLTIAERKRILLAHIYGVDIDYQAVEVTKLSLLLKVLEKETEATIQRELFAKQRALPDLADNIKCGNSLIGPDFYIGQQRDLFTDEDRLRINAFDWRGKHGFPKIFSGGNQGFDAVIGNPPYGASLSEPEVAYLREKYRSNTGDSYCLFIEQVLQLVNVEGLISMIVPTGWYSGASFTSLRRFFATTTDPMLFVNLPYDIFGAWVDTTIFLAKKRPVKTAWPRKEKCRVDVITFPKRHRIMSAHEFGERRRAADISQWFSDSNDEYLTYADAESAALMRRIEESGTPLGKVSDVQRGVTPFKLTKTANHENCKRAFNGTVRRYKCDFGDVAYVRLDDTLAEPKPERYFVGPRLLLRELISRQFQLQLAKTTDDFVTNKSMQSILAIPGGPDLDYLLGILNSRLMSWYFLRKSNIAQRDDFPKIVLKESRSLPVRVVENGNKNERLMRDKLVRLVSEIVVLHERIAKVKTDHERTALQHQIDHTDREIDALVYELYGLSDKEIALVEVATDNN